MDQSYCEVHTNSITVPFFSLFIILFLVLWVATCALVTTERKKNGLYSPCWKFAWVPFHFTTFSRRKKKRVRLHLSFAVVLCSQSRVYVINIGSEKALTVVCILGCSVKKINWQLSWKENFAKNIIFVSVMASPDFFGEPSTSHDQAISSLINVTSLDQGMVTCMFETRTEIAALCTW